MLVLLLACSSPAPEAPAPAPAPAVAPAPEHGSGTAAKGGKPVSDTEERPPRDTWQHTDELLPFFGIEAGTHVAVLGDGTGFLNAALASAVGDKGSVTALYTTPTTTMCDTPIPRVTCAATSVASPGLPESTRVLLVVEGLRPLQDRAGWLKAATGSIQPLTLGIVELKRGLNAPWAPPRNERINKNDVRGMVEPLGFEEKAQHKLPFQHAIRFER